MGYLKAQTGTTIATNVRRKSEVIEGISEVQGGWEATPLKNKAGVSGTKLLFRVTLVQWQSS